MKKGSYEVIPMSNSTEKYNTRRQIQQCRLDKYVHKLGLDLQTGLNSLSAGPINPGHQCPYLKSLIARPNFP